MAPWGLNDLTGALAPYSPHSLLFGRDPNGFADPMLRRCPRTRVRMLPTFSIG